MRKTSFYTLPSGRQLYLLFAEHVTPFKSHTHLRKKMFISKRIPIYQPLFTSRVFLFTPILLLYLHNKSWVRRLGLFLIIYMAFLSAMFFIRLSRVFCTICFHCAFVWWLISCVLCFEFVFFWGYFGFLCFSFLYLRVYCVLSIF